MTKVFLLFLFILVNIQTFVWSDCLFTWKYDLYVVNYLPSNSAPLKLHCASKNDDLGYHTLANGEDFHWSFCENFFPNTLFFCHLWWGSKQKSFVVFKSKWGAQHLHLYYWVAKSDGIYLSNINSTESLVKKYDWEV
ncbi:uncharacterized protein LOC105166650 [Sesamum indicum]|uniref:S-protein homolog n=1 Tax=Sesamum indicum TaxID=4182 RepID=A0A6I9TMA5_SESIN|nr:uncharacterized protein LOC105166650 [Sesamum indicum]